MPMILPHSRLSTGCQGSGAPSRRNSGAANRPFAHRSRRSRPGRRHRASRGFRAASCARSSVARARRPRVRIIRSRRSVAGPASSDSRPEALRRINSIWNMRSLACTNPIAAAASSVLAAWMRGMPSASKLMSTGADRPSIRASPVRPGSVSHKVPTTRKPISSSNTATPASIRVRTRPRVQAGFRRRRGLDEPKGVRGLDRIGSKVAAGRAGCKR